MYRYSLLYLALLFVAMAVDRRVLPRPTSARAPGAMLILDEPLPDGAPLEGQPSPAHSGHD
jgi:hypothetical protein